jgi:short-subunit dehydrogenase
MSFNLHQIDSQKGKIAIVTGANTGLGKKLQLV